MKRKVLIVLAGVSLLAIASISALAASPGDKIYAEGAWCYLPTGLQPVIFEDYQGDPNKQFVSATYDSIWMGTFTGPSTDYGLAVAHDMVPIIFIGTSSFTAVEVDGRVGNLEMDALGDRPGPTADWRGKWNITSGTGELENLQGQGKFWGPGWPPPEGGTEECPDNYGVIYYSGRIVFR
jgi:hypothetical protein